VKTDFMKQIVEVEY